MQSNQIYTDRRQRFIKALGKGSVAIIHAAKERKRNSDADYPYRQNSDFYYLTGFDEPEAVVVIIPGRKEGEYLLFNRARDEKQEIWVGPRAGQKGACEVFGADQAFEIGTIDEKMPELLIDSQRLYYPVGRDSQFDQQVMVWVGQVRAKVRTGVHCPNEFISIEKILHEMRLRKDDVEIGLMRKAAEITAQAHTRAMKVCKPGMMEYEIEAEIMHEFIKEGSASPAYTSIVGAGANSCVLHYVANRDAMKDGDILLIDAGAEYEYYASDVTRSFPVNGKFTDEQRAIYELVLKAQVATIEKVGPGLPWNELYDTAAHIIAEGLLALGLIKGNLKDAIANKTFAQFFMHNIGHWIGLDVHDVGEYKIDGKWRDLEAGFVLTVEPGIYIPPNSKGVDKKWWNIGIRIEDDVLVTKAGYDVLSAGVPKSIEEIESLMQ